MPNRLDIGSEDLLVEIATKIEARSLSPLRPGDVTATMIAERTCKTHRQCERQLKAMVASGEYETELCRDDRGYKVRAYRRCPGLESNGV